VSNNDASVRIFTVPDLRLIETIQFPTAINHSKFCFITGKGDLFSVIASVSPDGRTMISVGDDNRVHVYNVTNSGYEKTTTMAGKTKSSNHMT
jgi:WD40 repeat protein